MRVPLLSASLPFIRGTKRLINLFPPCVKYFGSLCTSATVGVNLSVGYNPRKLQDHQGCQQNGHESTSFSLQARCETFCLVLVASGL